jgi:hypothetical protein
VLPGSPKISEQNGIEIKKSYEWEWLIQHNLYTEEDLSRKKYPHIPPARKEPADSSSFLPGKGFSIKTQNCV